MLSCHCGCFVGRVFNGSGKAVDKGPQVLAEDYLDIQGLTHEAVCATVNECFNIHQMVGICQLGNSCNSVVD